MVCVYSSEADRGTVVAEAASNFVRVGISEPNLYTLYLNYVSYKYSALTHAALKNLMQHKWFQLVSYNYYETSSNIYEIKSRGT
jgi:hypothetical protein